MSSTTFCVKTVNGMPVSVLPLDGVPANVSAFEAFNALREAVRRIETVSLDEPDAFGYTSRDGRAVVFTFVPRGYSVFTDGGN